jgi:diguanylate cyclase (GGDEF)-like protein
MDILLLGVALQQSLFALGWWVAGRQLGLSRRAARHWAQGSLLTAVSLLLVQHHGVWPDTLTQILPGPIGVLAFVAIRRGSQMFVGLLPDDREHAAVIVLAALTVVVGIGFGVGWLARAAPPLLVAWTLLRTAEECWRGTRASEGRGVALMVSLPFALLGALYGSRVVINLLRPASNLPLNQTSFLNESQVLLFMAFGLVLNLVGAFTVARRLVRRLQQLSVRDPLTRLLNRRGLAAQLAREAGRLRRHREVYAVLAIDVDRFKAINDSLGHTAGDAVLVALAEVLRANARDIDQIARVGGEEFCVLLPCTDRVGALVAAERVRAAVLRQPWPGLKQALTVSVGVAVAERGDETAESVLRRADAALYRAKRLGRNRVELASQEAPDAYPTEAVTPSDFEPLAEDRAGDLDRT